MALQRGLVAFDHHHEISTSFLHNRARGLDLRVERVHQGDRALQIQSVQQGLARRDFVALVGHRFDSHGASTARIDRSHPLGALAATQRLAIHHDPIPILAAQASLLPGPDRLLKFQDRHHFEHPVNAVLRRHLITQGPPVEPTSKGRPLRRAQIPCKEHDRPVPSPAHK